MLPSARRGLYALRPLRNIVSSKPISLTPSFPSKAPVQSRLIQSYIQRAPFSSSWQPKQTAVAEADTYPASEQEFTRFDQLAQSGVIDPAVINVITGRMGIHTMTDVQRMTLNHCLDGADVIGQARTGTGKTLAFLMPIVQRILKDPELRGRGRFPPMSRASDIRALIISPTRELAEQIAVEAKKIVTNTGIQVQSAVGGTQKSYHLREMQRHGCHILVGTPGRVLDIVQDPSTGVSLDKIETFVMDEADRLLDIGFAPQIADIQSYMPPREVKPRQTLMFSATVPKSVVSLVRQTLRPDFKFIRTVDPDEAPTHASIPQKVVFVKGLQNYMPAILEIAHLAMDAHKEDPENNLPFKAIVYFGSTNEVGLAYETFRAMRDPGSSSSFARHPLSPCELYRMSSRLDQRQRTRESQGFRFAKSAILFSSDVTARGMDFPDVSHVIQIGPPHRSDDYVHRIGRTGRAGKPGQGWLLACEDEQREIGHKFRDSGITLQPTSLQTGDLDMTQAAQVPAHVARILQLVESGVKAVSYSTKASVYVSLLGVLKQQNPDRRQQMQIDMMNDLAKYGWGMRDPPSISQSLVHKLGFGGCRGINYEAPQSHRSDDRRNLPNQGTNRRRNVFDERDPFGQGMGSGKGVFGGESNDNDTTRGSNRGGMFDGESNDDDPFGSHNRGGSMGSNQRGGNYGRNYGRDRGFGGNRRW